ncbi:hypothetical protein ACFV5N_22975 [Streptomyces sp. NPDC059853]|uniref:hypothetical protein n=1 Tax=Streptomyces sp. NPDC059853 TaxID=3346973 RepID=UPI0036486EB1
MTTRRALWLPGAVAMALVLGGCGGEQDESDPPRSPESPAEEQPPAEAPPPDAGPQCEGDPPPSGTRVLRGGEATLPDGTVIAYTDGSADGTTRQAQLELVDGPDSWSVAAGDAVTIAGQSFDVAQVCTYRVVLAGGGQDGAGDEGEDVSEWPSTNEGRWSLQWHVPHNEPGADGLGVVVQEVRAEPARADILVVAQQRTVAFYKDVREGDTVEIAGKLWEVASVHAGSSDAAEGSPGFAAGTVHLQLLGPATGE